jgi:hypothetical protein
MFLKRKSSTTHDQKRLNLKRETLRTLNPDQLIYVAGGRECMTAAGNSC